MPRDDEVIKKDIVDELYWDNRIDAAKVKVTVRAGAVTLAGEVPTYGDLAAARAAAWSMAGVTKVTDDLTVSYAAPPPVPSDDDIATHVNDLLKWDPAIEETDIDVIVANGVVTLEGSVNAHWKRWFAEEKLTGVRGVIDIENKLAVVPTEQISDELVAEDVVAALDRDVRVNAEDVEVEVNDGIVVLSGSVPTATARAAAGRDASLTSGVTNVKNELLLTT